MATRRSITRLLWTTLGSTIDSRRSLTRGQPVPTSAGGCGSSRAARFTPQPLTAHSRRLGGFAAGGGFLGSPAAGPPLARALFPFSPFTGVSTPKNSTTNKDEGDV